MLSRTKEKKIPWTSGKISVWQNAIQNKNNHVCICFFYLHLLFRDNLRRAGDPALDEQQGSLFWHKLQHYRESHLRTF